MSIYYTQTLIPQDPDFVPRPEQVSEFLTALNAQESGPNQPSYRVGTITGRRTGTHPLTGETVSVPNWSYARLPEHATLAERLQAFDIYNAVVAGHGPPKNPPFDLYRLNDGGGYTAKFEKPYDFVVKCCVRSKAASMSDWHENISPPIGGIAPFGEPCCSSHETGYFHHPLTGALITVPTAACARFWIEFHCGKLLLPKIENDLNVLNPSIVQIAKTLFDVRFVQGCHWG